MRAPQVGVGCEPTDTEPAMAEFLPELLRLYTLLQDVSTDVTHLVHARLFIYAQHHPPFRDATASQLVRECRALRQIFVPLVADKPNRGATLALAHEIVDACISYVVDAFVHEEELLRQSRAKFAEFIDTIPQLVWRTTVDGEATFANRPFLDYVGCSKEEVLGWGWIGYIHPDDRPQVQQEWQRCRAAEMPVRVVFRVRGAQGYRWFLSVGNPYRDEHGTMVAYYGTWTDIHDYKSIEEQLQHAIAARDQFLSIASHELKTPLTSLQLQAEIQERALKRGDPKAVSHERVQRMLSVNTHQIARMAHLIDDMLDVGRIESGHLKLSKEPLRLGDFARDVVDQMRQIIEAAGCRVTLTVDREVAGLWDKFRLEQALNNFLNNACRYAPKSDIVVRVRQDAPDTATLSVSDNGPGVAAKDQHRIFARFERAISASERSGLGLGLYIVRQVVAMHGGQVALKSDLGQGCEFTLVLPTHDASTI